MTKLNGSEKQITWAEEIRNTFLNGIVCQGQIVDQGINQHIDFKQSQIDRDNQDLETETNESEITEIKEEIEIYTKELNNFVVLKNKIENESSAKWFIDNKMNNHSLFVKHVFSK
ncbi:hypothetical protein KA005_16770 [bacterium]|nr:hypothetical protein [bacterium]